MKKSSEEYKVNIFDKISRKDVDALMVALLECAEDSHIPELYDIFGKNHFLKFMDIFAGTTIKCPSPAELSNAIRNVGIYLKIREAPTAQKADLARDFSKKYKVPLGQITRVYAEMEDRMKRYNIK
jgi:hypothetical protein